MTDCLNGGTLTAVFKIISSNDSNEHFLLWDTHNDSPGPQQDVLTDLNIKHFRWTKNPIRRIIEIRRIVNSINPDIVHLHSSMAGLYGRLFLKNCKLAYSPHGYAFLRKDLHKFLCLLLFFVEKFLSKKTDYFVANWPIDFDNFAKLNQSVPILFVPLIDMNFLDYSYKSKKNQEHVVLGIGRISAAKGIFDFIDVASRLNFSDEKVCKFEWVGKYLHTNSPKIPQSDVNFVDWLSHDKLVKLISQSSILLITSHWESGPLTFYESLRMGTPAVVRNIQAFQFLSQYKFETTTSAVQIIEKALQDERYRKEMYELEVSEVKETFTFLSKSYPGYF